MLHVKLYIIELWYMKLCYHLTSRLAEGHEEVHEKEREPGHDEQPHEGSQGSDGLRVVRRPPSPLAQASLLAPLGGGEGLQGAGPALDGLGQETARRRGSHSGEGGSFDGKLLESNLVRLFRGNFIFNSLSFTESAHDKWFHNRLLSFAPGHAGKMAASMAAAICTQTDCHVTTVTW